MSYDMNIGEESFNYTYNVSVMWYEHNKKGIRLHYGLTGAKAIPLLLDLLDFMILNRKTLIKMNPKNGWGSYEGACMFVLKLIQASQRNPRAKWNGD